MVIGAITLDPNQVIGALRDDRWMATVLRFLVDRVAGVVIAGGPYSNILYWARGFGGYDRCGNS